MIGDLFDNPWKILIVAVVIIVLFGTAKLPVAARALGKSMRILKTEVHKLHDDDEDEAPAPAAVQAAQIQTPAPVVPVVPVAPVATAGTQAQIDALSKQLADLKQTANVPDGAQAQ